MIKIKFTLNRRFILAGSSFEIAGQTTVQKTLYLKYLDFILFFYIDNS